MVKSNIDLMLSDLRKVVDGDLYYDEISCLLYATDASVYKEKPLAVARPKTIEDLKKIISFAKENQISIIPRTAGTSLAGQVVGSGIVVDVSKYFTKILELNLKEKWVRVQPGVVLDELNLYLKSFGLFFGPETSTSNRCMMGGMVGNNACGARSIVFGSTRDHLLSVKGILSDGSEVEFSELSKDEFEKKCEGNSFENLLYKNIKEILSDTDNQKRIRKEFPDPSIYRRNTGYAVDLLLNSQPFSKSENKFNFCKLIAGSEGTLVFITDIKLNLVPLPPKIKALLCVHFNSREEAFKANLIALKYKPMAVEMMDNIILNCTKENIEQQKNRFFVKGDPEAILIIEFAGENKKEIQQIAERLIEELKSNYFGYHFPLVFGNDIPKVWNLRKSGLGVLSNVKGDAKPVTVIEDTAVSPKVLPKYMEDFKALLNKYNLNCVYYAHIGSGELHLRPVLNLKKEKDVELFHTIAYEIAGLVKKYKGSLSGEHGDGRLRGEFLPLMIGEENYKLLKKIKYTWDPDNLFNPGKIIDAPSMKEKLRYDYKKKEKSINTFFDFSNVGGILRAAEKCTGSGDCRKTEIIGGTMCPSFMALKDENASTRARANLLREFLTNSTQKNPFNHKELYDILDLCLSCKGCKSECPSSVDMAKMKAEFLQHYYDANGVPLRSWMVANISRFNRIASVIPSIYNFFIGFGLFSSLIKKIIGFSKKRKFPLLYKYTFRRWLKKNLDKYNFGEKKEKTICLFIDEFTNYNDVEIGIVSVKLLAELGYKILVVDHYESGRTYLSKGFVRKAKMIANKNVSILQEYISDKIPLVGIEPSSILTFRDEYPDLVDKELVVACNTISDNSFLIDEFLANEIKKGNISKEQFTKKEMHIKLHGHCQQKAIASTDSTKKILSFPQNYSVEEIKSGCCGMAGSFGFEKEHYELSMKVGELVLFPEIRKTPMNVLIAAGGTSCRHQIKDGTGRIAYHPIQILYDALNR